MTDAQVFVTHASEDLDLAQDLFGTVRNLPVGVHLAMEELEAGRTRSDLKGRLANADVVVAVLTAEGVADHWVNQEIGFATARGIPVLPLYEPPVDRPGYLANVEGVQLDREEVPVTVFNLLCRLRAEIAPLGTLSTPNWYLEFPCNFEGCGHRVVLDVEQQQKDLWQQYEHNQPLVATCGECGSRYLFNPGTLGYVRREDPAEQEQV
ncbi:toll/interleukin-1 receptor domain-containing protein [Haloarchaeobius amylolyticus]|uniref:toll/interleukin-1 receptor domain-containing protein n=1 Tax=Haloarchaeobius amylolyticus TaxID=1198296 RepID=UPI00226F5867|nr:toll/interleukin-1 receptor domain-containing protein [Haloarchaeobius amylolyticus]